jgi:hypothetical protein
MCAGGVPVARPGESNGCDSDAPEASKNNTQVNMTPATIAEVFFMAPPPRKSIKI